MIKRNLLLALATVAAACMLGLCAGCGAPSKGGEVSGSSESGRETSSSVSPGISPSSTIFVAGESGDLIFTLSGSLDSLKKDGKEVESENYSADRGILTLKADYLASLPLGSHTFVCTGEGREYTLAVRCYKAPSVSPERAEYDWSNPADVSFSVGLGGAELTGVTLGGEPLTKENYTFSENVLILKKETVEERCDDGDNAGSLTTDVGEAEFVVHCFYSEVTASFDSVGYRLQTEAGESVAFSFDAKGKDYLLEERTENGYEAVSEEKYFYDVENKSLTIFNSYLDTLYADIYAFRITVDDDAESVFDFYVGTHGADGTAHPALPGSMYGMNCFDSLAAGANFGGSNVETDVFFSQGATNEVIGGEEAIDGRSLLFSSLYGTDVGWNTFFGINSDFRKGVLYLFSMKIKLLPAEGIDSCSLAFRFMGSAEIYGLIVDWNASSNTFTLGQKSDSRTNFSYDRTSGVLSVEIYMVPSVDGMNFTLTAVNAGRSSIVLDDLSVLKTDMPASLDGYVGGGIYIVKDGGDCTVALDIPGGMSVTSVALDGEILSKDEYMLTESGLLLKEAVLSGLSGGEYEIDVTAEYIGDIFGRKIETSFSGVLTLYVTAPAALTGSSLQKQTSAGGALSWTIDAGSYKLARITYHGETVASTNFTYLDGVLTLKAEYLDGLGAGLQSFTAVFEENGEEDISVKIAAAVYGTEKVHVEDALGVISFGDCEPGTLGSEIYDSSKLSSWSGGEQIKVVADDVFGRALSIPSSAAGAGCLSFNALKSGVVYCLRLTFRTENDAAISSLLLKWNSATAESNDSWIENNALKIDTKDARTEIERDSDTNVYTWTSWLTKKPAEDAQLILWPVVAQGLIIGSVELFETASEEAARLVWTAEYNYADYTKTLNLVNSSTVIFNDAENDLYIIQHLNDQGGLFNSWRIADGDTVLREGTDYTVDNYAVTLSKGYLATIEGSKTLTICRGNDKVFDLKGETIYQSATVVLVNASEEA